RSGADGLAAADTLVTLTGARADRVRRARRMVRRVGCRSRLESPSGGGGQVSTAVAEQRSAIAPIIGAHEASKWYGEVLGLNRVTLSIGAGITSLAGPNGSG